MHAKGPQLDDRLLQINKLIVHEGGDQLATRQRLERARELFHELLAERFQQPFRDYLTPLSHASYTEKSAACVDANAALRALGLAIKCPQTGQSGVLHARPDYGKSFQLELLNGDSSRSRTAIHDVSRLELTGYPIRGVKSRARG